MLVSNHTRSVTKKISQCLGVNLRTVQWIQKENPKNLYPNPHQTMSSELIYGGTATQKLHYNSSDKKKNSWISWQDPSHDWYQSQQVNQVHSQEHGSVWVSYQAGSVWRYLVFLIQNEKGQFLSQAMKDKRKAFEQTQVSSSTKRFGFSHMRKISARIRWYTYRTNIGLQSLQDVSILIKNQTTSPHHDVWGDY